MMFSKLIQVTYLFVAVLCASSVFAASPDLLLAKTYQKNEQAIDVSDYLISEKYDGVRALWNGKQLVSRQGNVYHAPAWFLADFPTQSLDGELWIARGHFEAVISTVRKDQPIDAEWKKIRYMVFELPNATGSFSERVNKIKSLLSIHKSPYLQLIDQFHLPDHDALIKKLNRLTQQGAEGLMMHLADAPYQTGRSDVLLKVKRYQDAEATVIAHIEGKGKYKGMLGALLLENKQGQRFKVGNGFSDKQRQNPPPIKSLITYKYYGLTKNSIPRFASFLRIRSYPTTND